MCVASRRWIHSSASVALTVMIVLAAVSCGSDHEHGAQDSAVSQTDSPEAARIVDIVRGKMTELDLSAAVFGVWRGDKQIASGALGGSPLGVPATPDMQVRVGQPMEPMLSTVLLQLNQEGVARLDEPIAKWVPDFPRADQITPRMLANGTTGISDYVTDPEFLKTFYANPIKGFTSQELFDLANARPPLFAPGSSFPYAHSDLVVLGVVLEKATGKSLGDLIQQRVLDPLGMKQSRVMLTPQMVEPSLHGYSGTTPSLRRNSIAVVRPIGPAPAMSTAVSSIRHHLHVIDRG